MRQEYKIKKFHRGRKQKGPRRRNKRQLNDCAQKFAELDLAFNIHVLASEPR
jgi:hypothetical protein